MTIGRRIILLSLPLALFASISATKSATPVSWDGTWTGRWGGKDDTSIKIVENKVVEYSYKGSPRPVDTGEVTEKQLSFGTKLFTITMTRTSESTAVARFGSETMGATEANLTRQ